MVADRWRKNQWQLAMLFAIALLAAGLRVAHLDRPSLFYDEVIVMQLATQPDTCGACAGCRIWTRRGRRCIRCCCKAGWRSLGPRRWRDAPSAFSAEF